MYDSAYFGARFFGKRYFGGTGGAPPVATDHRTLYAKAATRKSSTAAIDPTKTVASRK